MVVAPNMNVVIGGIVIKSTTKLGSGLGGVLVGRNLNQSSTLLITTIGVVGRPQMVFTNLVMITHVNMTANRPSMSSMVVGGYKSVDVVNPRGGYR
jgi:hypothetical protein